MGRRQQPPDLHRREPHETVARAGRHGSLRCRDRTQDPPKNLYNADIVRASVDRPGMKERYLTKLGVRLMGRKVDSQRGENLNSLFIAACQQVDQVFLVGLAKYDSVEQPLLAQALKPRRVAALR